MEFLKAWGVKIWKTSVVGMDIFWNCPMYNLEVAHFTKFVDMQGTAKKCIKIYHAYAEALYCSLKPVVLTDYMHYSLPVCPQSTNNNMTSSGHSLTSITGFDPMHILGSSASFSCLNFLCQVHNEFFFVLFQLDTGQPKHRCCL